MRVLTAMIDGLDWSNLKLLWLCKWLTIFLVGILAVNVFLGVFFRYALNDSLSWYEESSKYLMLWLVFTGAPIVLKQNGHVSLDLLPKLVPRRLQDFNYLVIYTIVLMLLCVFVWQGFDLAWRARAQQMTTIDVSFFWVYLAIPLGCAVMVLVSLETWLVALRGLFRSDDTDLDARYTTDRSMS